ncbi:MAG: peptidylprolyl isomerase [bacterium]|nr:peptidylprolyl isomerase [bacterium]
MRTFCVLALAFCFAGAALAEEKVDAAVKTIDDFIAEAGINKEDKNWRTKVPAPPQASFTEGKTYTAHMETSKGTIVLELMPGHAPMHVSAFIYLTRIGFYDGLSFHRVIQNFMAQGGCPLGTGTGGPGYRIAGEHDPSVKHDRAGMLSTANTGRPKTDGSQFFITFKPTAHLDGKHTIYGHLVEGMDTLKALEAAGSGSGRTTEPLMLEKVTIKVN